MEQILLRIIVFLQIFIYVKRWKTKKMQSFEMNDDQRRIYIDAAQLHEAYMDAYTRSSAYRGGMHWKKAKGKE